MKRKSLALFLLLLNLIINSSISISAEIHCGDGVNIKDCLKLLIQSVNDKESTIQNLSAQIQGLSKQVECQKDLGVLTGEKCEKFMMATEKMVTWSERWQTCKDEFGEKYVPCNAFQAIGLSNVVSNIQNAIYYWLTPGGSGPLSQEGRYVLFRSVEKPSPDIMCSENQALSFFHNWIDNSHSDSIVCRNQSEQLSVLCCHLR
ncbi:MAG: hypothetical protein HQK51_06400 [Oligoflexia bacterium]|nr:hypothetical protein [Oligoflexia bacterium]